MKPVALYLGLLATAYGCLPTLPNECDSSSNCEPQSVCLEGLCVPNSEQEQDAKIQPDSTVDAYDAGLAINDAGRDYALDMSPSKDQGYQQDMSLDAGVQDATLPVQDTSTLDSFIDNSNPDMQQVRRCYQNDFNNDIADVVAVEGTWEHQEGTLYQPDGTDGISIAYVNQNVSTFDFSSMIKMPIGQGRDQEIGVLFGYHPGEEITYIVKLGNAQGTTLDVTVEAQGQQFIDTVEINQERWQFNNIALGIVYDQGHLTVSVNEQNVGPNQLPEGIEGVIGFYTRDSKLEIDSVNICEK